jgi:putative glutamine amidotransferase
MTALRPPLVAVTASTRLEDGVARVRLNRAYLRALDEAGLVPLVVPPLAAAHAAAVLDAVSGLVLTGGEDVDPAQYGARPHAALGPVHGERDAWELALVGAARDRGTPTLAICRGIQLLNVALGGTLVQDLPSDRPSEVAHDPPGRPRGDRTHDVAVVAGSALAAALGSTRLAVNSTHHQAVDRAAEGLRVVARAPDGVVEGMESDPGAPWPVLAVQWHPEELVADAADWDRRLFAAYARLVHATPAAG